MERFKTVLEIASRKKKKGLVENKFLKEIRASTNNKHGPIRPSNRGWLPRLQEGYQSRAFPEGGNDIQMDGLLIIICKGAYTVRSGLL